jgi:hypothetical protein
MDHGAAEFLQLWPGGQVIVKERRKMPGEDMAAVFQLWEYNRAADGARR